MSRLISPSGSQKPLPENFITPHGRYVRPIFVGNDEEPQVKLLGSRHPVLDAVSAGQVVPNDISLSGSGCRVQVITGCVYFVCSLLSCSISAEVCQHVFASIL